MKTLFQLKELVLEVILAFFILFIVSRNSGNPGGYGFPFFRSFSMLSCTFC